MQQNSLLISQHGSEGAFPNTSCWNISNATRALPLCLSLPSPLHPHTLPAPLQTPFSLAPKTWRNRAQPSKSAASPSWRLMSFSLLCFGEVLVMGWEKRTKITLLKKKKKKNYNPHLYLNALSNYWGFGFFSQRNPVESSCKNSVNIFSLNITHILRNLDIRKSFCSKEAEKLSILTSCNCGSLLCWPWKWEGNVYLF